MKLWLQYKEGESVLSERFIRTLKNNVNKYVTSILKNVYIDKLGDIIHEYNNKYHITIKRKPVDAKSDRYIDFKKENTKKDPKFKVGDHVKISKCKNIFSKGYVSNLSKEVLGIKK